MRVAQLRKWNSQRRALSQPTSNALPVLTRQQVMYIPAGAMEGEPATCYNCAFYNYGRSCRLLGPGTEVRKFVYPPQPTRDARSIEYWPCCGAWQKGTPNYGEAIFLDQLTSPDQLGLVWINAPEVGQEIGGANCGGRDGGDDCDHYCTDGPGDKREYPTARCRVLQASVENGGVCVAWQDDDQVEWQKAAGLLRELKGAGDGNK